MGRLVVIVVAVLGVEMGTACVTRCRHSGLARATTGPKKRLCSIEERSTASAEVLPFADPSQAPTGDRSPYVVRLDDDPHAIRRAREVPSDLTRFEVKRNPFRARPADNPFHRSQQLGRRVGGIADGAPVLMSALGEQDGDPTWATLTQSKSGICVASIIDSSRIRGAYLPDGGSNNTSGSLTRTALHRRATCSPTHPQLSLNSQGVCELHFLWTSRAPGPCGWFDMGSPASLNRVAGY